MKKQIPRLYLTALSNNNKNCPAGHMAWRGVDRAAGIHSFFFSSLLRLWSSIAPKSTSCPSARLHLYPVVVLM